ncbi:DNA damage-regulated autophagy modulator protein 1-like [Xenopus laevis]|uniref:DNA damage-regulated autophagy modulator protein 1-like n=1 Tax=Xenopus laevis TaxID=8355 RepID=A0A8J1MA30_XENLA|nr:DNA damage-regulated autophagy modulator protein 1-like [Xenopus laevis]XP_041438200.1 DNA damage-regulated autophagy modulator protein 1-like [Xenopus laevis]XP_041438201.1 DNA damage-regulated autophagy modulator protein 1-like [Xenopus laevis]
MKFCCFNTLAIVPVLWSVLMFLGFVSGYIVAVTLGHLEPFVPYISDLGLNAPESYIFSAVCTLSAILGAITMYGEYKYFKLSNPNGKDLHNKIILGNGLLSCVGILIAGYFQEFEYEYVHLIGAVLAFGQANLYAICHCYYYYKLSLWKDNTRLFLFRVVLASSLTSIFLCLSLLFIGCKIYDHSCMLADWDFPFRQECATMEWLELIGICIFLLTLKKEMQQLGFRVPKSLKEDWIVKTEKCYDDVEAPEDPISG